MADIDVGAAAENRISYWGNDTVVAKENPANATGVIDYIAIYSTWAMKGVEVASLVHEGSNVLSTNGVSGALGDQAGSGLNEYSAPTDFSAFDINENEYIGYYCTTPGIDRVGEGEGVWYAYLEDRIPAKSITFTWSGSNTISLYAEGTVAAPPVVAKKEDWGLLPVFGYLWPLFE